jgi:hypothetical protein
VHKTLTKEHTKWLSELWPGRTRPALPQTPPTPARRNRSRSTPVSPTPPTAADRLENTLERLNSLLWCCHGTGDGWFEEVGEQHRDNLLWIASDLAREAVGLFQESAGELRS